ncbi:UvrD-helicase domain-containing protein [Nocardiopsis metallicus]|uniref:UvrD-like helicase ATP-binding domain-containing protein n=1 Tax=Nocardiopsis metallicus TaxID=179819 RepID=A0A840WHI4_9ACTN|nr:ATP-dependent helicase [Nocardiopsis metallicus]MBB5491375.1 hypothetical protein [Nocardiopsis metallicus]
MPLLLDDLDLTKTKKVDAKFFSSKLNGSGKKTGRLHQGLRPLDTTSIETPARIELKTTTTQHDITVVTVPLAGITRRALETLPTATLPTPDVDERFVVETDSDDWEAVFDMTPQALVLREDKSSKPIKHELTIQYRTELVLMRVGMIEPERVVRLTEDTNLAVTDAAVILDWDASPMETAAGAISLALGRLGIAATNLNALDAWMNEYPIHDRIVRLAETWSSEAIAAEVDAYIADVTFPDKEVLNALAIQLRYLENYSVPLEAYGRIHRALTAAFDSDVAQVLAKQNLNLLMNHTLAGLDTIKPQLARLVPPDPPPALPEYLSPQQVACVSTTEPLVMVRAGAGTGKSSTIIERIAHLVACGVNPVDITVLSFTNAAADNIKERNPDVGSMTIAAMINDIYQLNHSGHDISSIDTIINSLEIFFPTDQVAADFRARLLDVDKNKIGAATSLNTFVERHYDRVMAMLDAIGQTSLELEIIICYQRIDEMVEPTHVACRHLIIDEVQDNSVFEFIYMLKYVAKHLQSLYIVGDASQTLFEFRSANPRALNTLEGSGVFATYELTTNYRSNQEILDFANVVLSELETNQLAQIQLRANSLEAPTKASFEEKVRLDYVHLPQMRGFLSNELSPLLANRVLPQYVDPCLARGEQVVFLAFSRREVALMQALLESRYPDRHVASLVSERVFATDIFSKYIKFFWNDVLQVPPNNATFVVTQGIRDNMEKLTKNVGNPKVERAVLELVSKWWLENGATTNAWVNLVHQGSMPSTEFFTRLRDNLLAFEIAQNAVKKSLTDARNRARKEKNLGEKVDLVVSTIHGVKGLEFDNAVILHKDDKTMAQDVRRLYYVAFTRAKKTEYVLSYGTTDKPVIVSTHEAIGNLLVEREAQAAEREKHARALALGIDPDLVDDEETAGVPVPQSV